MRGSLLAVLLLGACRASAVQSAWWQPSDLTLHSGWTDIDHDRSVYDGQQFVYGVSLTWPMGLRRAALQEQAKSGDYARRLTETVAVRSEQVVEAVHQQTAAVTDAIDDFDPVRIESQAGGDKVVVVNPGATETTVETLTQNFTDKTPVGGVPIFAWAALALGVVLVCMAVAAKAGVHLPFLTRRPKNGGQHG
jgi:hypothetical protein